MYLKRLRIFVQRSKGSISESPPWPNVVIVAPRAKSVCSFVSLVQTNLGTKSVCNVVTKRSNGFGYTSLDHSRSHKIEKTKKNGSGPFSYSFFVPIRVGLATKKTQTYETIHAFRSTVQNLRLRTKFDSD